ncbi:MAG: VTT domain-containing protein [Thermofilaceae archaeon]
MPLYLRWLVDLGGLTGYLSVFLVSMFGNLIPFIPIPYLAGVAIYSALLPCNPLLVGILSGLGAGFGKLIVYLLGRGARVLLKEDTSTKYEKFGKLLKGYGAFAVFIFAVTPSPDDAIIIPLGLMKYDVTKFLAGVIAGKVVLSIIVAYGGRFIAGMLVEDLIWGTTISVVAFIIVMVVLVFIDWETVLGLVGEKGIMGFLEEIREKGFQALMKSGKSQTP